MAYSDSCLCIFFVSLHYYFFTCLANKNITTDEFALLAFKSSITLDPYHMLGNWSISSTASFSSCNWAGVICDKHHGRVKALSLRNMGLQGRDVAIFFLQDVAFIMNIVVALLYFFLC